MTCTECKASLVVTAHGYTTNRGTAAIHFTVKSSMHEPGCSLVSEGRKMTSMAKLPLLGNKVAVLKGAFTAKSI